MTGLWLNNEALGRAQNHLMDYSLLCGVDKDSQQLVVGCALNCDFQCDFQIRVLQIKTAAFLLLNAHRVIDYIRQYDTKKSIEVSFYIEMKILQ